MIGVCEVPIRKLWNTFSSEYSVFLSCGNVNFGLMEATNMLFFVQLGNTAHFTLKWYFSFFIEISDQGDNAIR